MLIETPEVCIPDDANAIAKSKMRRLLHRLIVTMEKDEQRCSMLGACKTLLLHGILLVTSDELVRLSSLGCHISAAEASEQAHGEAVAY